jgi:hypothetical protein
MTGSAAKSESPTDAAALLPPRLSIGDRARLIFPASFPTAEWVEETRHILEDWGLVVDVGRHAMDQWGFMAGRDQDRLDDLNEAFRDPGVRAVIAIVGGAGAYRIARTSTLPLSGQIPSHSSASVTSRACMSPGGATVDSPPFTAAWPATTRSARPGNCS